MATPGLCESFHFTQHESEGEETRVRRGDKHTSGVGGRRVRRRHGDGGGGEGGGGRSCDLAGPHPQCSSEGSFVIIPTLQCVFAPSHPPHPRSPPTTTLIPLANPPPRLTPRQWWRLIAVETSISPSVSGRGLVMFGSATVYLCVCVCVTQSSHTLCCHGCVRACVHVCCAGSSSGEADPRVAPQRCAGTCPHPTSPACPSVAAHPHTQITAAHGRGGDWGLLTLTLTLVRSLFQVATETSMLLVSNV